MELLAQVPAGAYTVRNLTAATQATVTVPTLTASITQGSATVGATLTLTTNASPRSTYQWRRNGTSIAGATANTLNTSAVAAGSIDCVVTSGVQTVTTVAITLSPGVSRSIGRQTPYVLSLPAGNAITSGSHSANLGFTAAVGERLIVAASIQRFSGTGGSILSVSVGGQAMTQRQQINNSIWLGFWEIPSVTAALAATDQVVINWGAGFSIRDISWQFYKPSGYGAVFAGFAASAPTNQATFTQTLNVPADGAVLFARAHSTMNLGDPAITGATFRSRQEIAGAQLSTVYADIEELALETARVVGVTETAATPQPRIAAISLAAA